jgi:predicted RNase H-like HicB family nuclease
MSVSAVSRVTAAVRSVILDVFAPGYKVVVLARVPLRERGWHNVLREDAVLWAMSTGVEPTITLTEDGDWWVAEDTKTGVTSQGRTRHEALDNLDEALAGFHGEGEAPTDEDRRELGIDPENDESRSLEDSDVFE